MRRRRLGLCVLRMQHHVFHDVTLVAFELSRRDTRSKDLVQFFERSDRNVSDSTGIAQLMNFRS